MHKCQTKYCRNITASKGTKLCGSCRKRKSREADPVKYAYDNLKSSAKRRGKDFTISLNYFRKFCVRFDYITGKGRSQESYTVDRIKNEKGYIPGNLQKLTLQNNARKGSKHLVYDWQTRTAYVMTYTGMKVSIDNPF